MPTLRHPDVHAPWSQWSEDQTLHVAVGYSNPFRWRSRRELMNRFRDHMERQANVVLHVGELAYGDRQWEVTSPDRATDIQLRTATTEHFIKENLQNVIIQHFPSSWKYGMACDADFHMITPGWALETIHQLQHYDWLQPFSSYMDVSGNIYGQANMPVRLNTSFCFNYIANNYQVSPQYHNGVIGPDGKIVRKASSDYESWMATIGGPEGEFMRGCGATGGAFAFRRSAFETVGGFLDRCILGHSDWLQMHLLVGVEPPDIHSQKYHPVYKEYVRSWGRKAERLRKNVGYVDAMATHFWHGSKSRRAYSSRDIILAEEQYHPYDDLATDSQGIYQLRPDAVGLRDKIRKYFISRSEDSAELGIGEKILV